jgi:outer membrane protein OmpA-like peptidoglycan-associated protein
MNKFLFIFLFVSLYTNSQEKTNTISVYFNSNSSDLTTIESEVLSNLFSDETLIFSTINVHGFCDDIGSFESNMILSEKRAQYVSDLLRNKFKLNVLISLGKGEIAIENSSSNLDEIRKNNRRVTVFYTYTEAKSNNSINIEKSNQELSYYKTFNDKLIIGDKIILKNLLFEGGLTVFQKEEDAKIELDKIIEYLNKNPNATIEIQGHVCCIGIGHGDAYDKVSGKVNLSHTRAKKIYNYLVEKGISKNRMTYMGYGRKFPIPNGVEENNRRVEILITKI